MEILLRVRDAIFSVNSYKEFTRDPAEHHTSYLFWLVLVLAFPVLLMFMVQMDSGAGSARDKLNNSPVGFYSLTNGFAVTNNIKMQAQNQYLPPRSLEESTALRLKLTELPADQRVKAPADATAVDVTAHISNRMLTWIQITHSSILLLGITYNWFAKVLIMMLGGGICLIFARIQKAAIDFKTGKIIALYGMTLPVIIDTIQKLIWPSFPFPNILFMSLLMAYLWMGVMVMREVEPEAALIQPE
ncbi:MAG: DUF1189 family protein [Candidatus Saccharibacteria bacterium]